MEATGQPAQPLPMWSITANVVEHRPYGAGGEQSRRGVKLFAAGAKVYIAGGFAGMGNKTVTVIGRTRHAHGYTIVHLPREYLTGWRVELVYSPAAARHISEVRHGSGGGFGLRDLDPTSVPYRDALTSLAQTLNSQAGQDRRRRLTRHGATMAEAVMRVLRWVRGPSRRDDTSG